MILQAGSVGRRGGGFTYDLTRGSGFRVDLRLHIRPNEVDTEITATPANHGFQNA